MKYSNLKILYLLPVLASIAIWMKIYSSNIVTASIEQHKSINSNSNYDINNVVSSDQYSGQQLSQELVSLSSAPSQYEDSFNKNKSRDQLFLAPRENQDIDNSFDSTLSSEFLFTASALTCDNSNTRTNCVELLGQDKFQTFLDCNKFLKNAYKELDDLIDSKQIDIELSCNSSGKSLVSEKLIFNYL